MKIKQGEKVEITEFVLSLLKTPAVITTDYEIYVTNPKHITHIKYNKDMPTIEIMMTNGKIVLKFDDEKRLTEVSIE